MEIRLSPLDLEAFRAIVREEIKNAAAEELYTREELCEKLGVDKSTYHKYVRTGKLVVRKFGRKLKVVSTN